MKKTLTAFFLAIAATGIARQEQLELDPVTITSSLKPEKLSQTGRNIVLFRGEEFANLPIHSVDDLLRYLPGMEVQQRGPMGSQSDIVLRGGTFQQVLVLLDGVRINDPNTGHFSSYIPIVPGEIDHIEILKGASSALYGSEAVGGVVHIISKSFSVRRGQKQLRIQASATAGEYDLLSLQAGAFYQQGATAISGGLLSNNSSGRQQRGIRGFAHNNTGSVSVTRFLKNNWQLSLRSGYDKRDFSAQNFYTNFLSDTAREEVSTFWNQARISWAGSRHRISMDAGYKKVKDDYAFNKLSVANQNKSSLLQATITDEWKLRSRTSLISGVQFIEKGIRSNDRGHHQVWQGAAFFLFSHAIGEHFTLHPAMRIEYNQRSGAEWVPQLNLSYKLKQWQFRGSAGKTIRDADFTERFNNYNKALVNNGGRMGDPDLQAERSFSYEAGADYFLSQTLRISGSFFQRFHKRLIDYVATPYADMPRKDNLVAGAIYALAKNISSVNTTGVELDIQYQRKTGKDGFLYGAAGIVWLDSKSSQAQPSFYISSHAKFLSNFFLEWRNKKLLFSINGVYKERARQTAGAINAVLSKEYFLLNMKAGFFVCRNKLNIFTRVDNVLDTKYSDLLGAAMPGRWWMGGVSWMLSR